MKTIIQITDTHLYDNIDARLEWTDSQEIYPNRNLLAVLEQCNQINPDALIISGDLAQDETLATYQWLNDELKKLTYPVYCIPGNHDKPDLMKQAIPDFCYFDQGIELGNWQILLMDTSIPEQPSGEIDEQQLTKLEQQLSNNPDSPALVFIHHHPIPIGCSYMDGMMLNNAEPFLSTIAAHKNVRHLFHGHLHGAFEKRYQHLPISGAPATSVQADRTDGKVIFINKPAWREIKLSEKIIVSDKIWYLEI